MEKVYAIADSKSDKLPETFLKLLTENSAAIENGIDLLALAYHGLMLECGFSHDSDVFKHCDKPDSVYRFKYWLTRDPEQRPVSLLLMTPVGSSVIISGEHPLFTPLAPCRIQALQDGSRLCELMYIQGMISWVSLS